jgi:hypothetical protein
MTVECAWSFTCHAVTILPIKAEGGADYSGTTASL